MKKRKRHHPSPFHVFGTERLRDLGRLRDVLAASWHVMGASRVGRKEGRDEKKERIFSNEIHPEGGETEKTKHLGSILKFMIQVWLHFGTK